MKLTDLNVSFLKYFYDAVENQSVTQASLKNNVSRPAVSQAIRKLEEVVGAKLLEHGKNNFQLTQDGEQIFIHAQTFLRAGQEFISRQHSAGSKIQLKVGVSQSLFEKICLPALKRYKKTAPMPGARFEIQFGSSMKIRKMIETGRLDFGIMIDDGMNQHLQKQIIESGKFVIIKKPKDTIKNGINCTDDRPEVAHLKKLYKSKFKKDLTITHRLNSWTALTNATINGFGPSLIPAFMVPKSCKIDSLSDKMRGFQIICIYKKPTTALPKNRLFLNCLSRSSGEKGGCRLSVPRRVR